jgi:hypothetical protein
VKQGSNDDRRRYWRSSLQRRDGSRGYIVVRRIKGQPYWGANARYVEFYFVCEWIHDGNVSRYEITHIYQSVLRPIKQRIGTNAAPVALIIAIYQTLIFYHVFKYFSQYKETFALQDDAFANEFRRLLGRLFVATRGVEMRLKIVELIRNEPSNINRISNTPAVNYRTVEHHIGMLERNHLIILRVKIQ